MLYVVDLVEKLPHCDSRAVTPPCNDVTEIVLISDLCVRTSEECAVSNNVTLTHAKHDLDVKILCEAANGPTTPDCDELIKEAGIMLIPDFLCNAGGVTCSYFEQVQCNMNYFWPKDEVLQKLEAAMTKAFQDVYDLAQEKQLYMRDAAYVISINRVVNAVKARGWV